MCVCVYVLVFLRQAMLKRHFALNNMVSARIIFALSKRSYSEAAMSEFSLNVLQQNTNHHILLGGGGWGTFKYYYLYYIDLNL